ncbi:probable serine hydrolase isoform X1 [Anabrus simplex]|uniref:probable serine hydrolase isoform X1 n=1 Tax=Anabrus simplex TaxID=316456 RepID=UPI0035A32171
MYKLTSGLRRSLSSALIGRRNQHQKATQTIGEEFQEINIPVPWGHIAGKWWGQKDIQPVVGLHGWENNAGTFDNLAPLLTIRSFLAFDWPGHGLSSHIPLGRPYYFMDSVLVLRQISKYFKWDKISIIGHSYGSCVGFVYAAVFPDSVENYVSIDCARTLMASEIEQEGMQLRLASDMLLNFEDKLVNSNPPCYDYDHMVDLLHIGSLKSVTKDSSKILLRRGMRKTVGDTECYHFSRDLRLQCHAVGRFPNEFLLKMAPRIHCNHLSIRGLQGLIIGKKEDEYFRTLNLIQKSSNKVEHHDIEGTHHVHLNNAERVAPIINSFLHSLYPPEC